MTEIQKVETKAIDVVAGSRGLSFQSFDELARFAKAVVDAGLAPKGLERPQAILVAIQKGMELGLTPMRALESIAVINGRSVLYGDAPLGICMASGTFDHSQFDEKEIGKQGSDAWGYSCTVARKGSKPHTATFTVADAKRAQLWGKSGPWTFYPDRMLKARARAFALRDTFPDVLGGIGIKEEVDDVTPVTITQQPTTAVDRAAAKAAELMATPTESNTDVLMEATA